MERRSPKNIKKRRLNESEFVFPNLFPRSSQVSSVCSSMVDP